MYKTWFHCVACTRFKWIVYSCRGDYKIQILLQVLSYYRMWTSYKVADKNTHLRYQARKWWQLLQLSGHCGRNWLQGNDSQKWWKMIKHVMSLKPMFQRVDLSSSRHQLPNSCCLDEERSTSVKTLWLEQGATHSDICSAIWTKRGDTENQYVVPRVSRLHPNYAAVH